MFLTNVLADGLLLYINIKSFLFFVCRMDGTGSLEHKKESPSQMILAETPITTLFLW